MAGVQPVPCPVRLGTVKTGGLPAQLHKWTLERNLHKVEKLLKKGVDVDCVNHLGQTPLFCASLLGFTSVAELLLQYGADPNYRCGDRSTPLHAAVFSCNPWLLSELLDAGGDLRVHDDQGRTPRDWAEAGAQEHSSRMLDFLKRCVSHMRGLSQTQYLRHRRVTPTSSKTLLRSPSLLELLRPGGSELLINKKLSTKSVCDMVQCFGYGKLCVEKARQPVGLLASVPLIGESELAQAEDEALHSFTCGPFSRMTNYSWRGCRVSVKELQANPTQQRSDQDGYLDLLIAELEYCSQLFHPHLLQLMAVSMTSDLQQSKLVYERVHMDSLYGLLYHRRMEFPVLQMWEVLEVVLHVCEALVYLQGRALVLRALSSHCVLIVHPGVAKVTGLGFMVPSEDCCRGNGPPIVLPEGLYNWAAPEVIRRRGCTGKADLYSLCTLIQEIYTDAVPWGSVDPRLIKQAVDAGQALHADPAVPQPYYTLLQSGLQPCVEDRTCSLQDLRYMLRSDLQELSRKERRVGVRPLSAGLNMLGWSGGVKQDRGPEVAVQPSVDLERKIQDQLCHLDSFLEKETEEKTSQSSLGSLQANEAESCPYYEALQRDISYRDLFPLEDWRLTLQTPSSEAGSSEDPWSSSSTAGEHLATRAALSSSEHIGSIVLNLKVSQVLLEQVESSLDSAELGLEGGVRSDRPHTLVSGCDEVDGVGRRSESGVLVLKAIGPPCTYRPQLELQGDGWVAGGWQGLGVCGDEQVSQYCSAGEESFSSDEGDRGVSGIQQRRDRQKTGLKITEKTDRPYGSSYLCEPQERATPQHVHLTSQAKPNWTSEVREVVALMTKGRLRTPAQPEGSSVSEDVEEQLPLLARLDPLGLSNSQKVWQRDMALEQLVKSPAGVPSESEESTDFHTVSHTVFLPSSVGEESRCPDCTQSLVEASSMFYTPERETECADASEEDSQTLSSEEDMDVTMEVCRGNKTVAVSPVMEARAREFLPVSEEQVVAEPDAPGQDRLDLLPTSSHMQDLANIDELSSITCSPGQQQQWAGQDGSPYSPNSRGCPPHNSTPRSPGTHTGPARNPCYGKEMQFLHLQGAQATPPSDSACNGAYTTASLGASYRADSAESNILKCPEGGTENVDAHGRAGTLSQAEEVEETVLGSCAPERSTSRRSTPSPDAAPACLQAAGLDEEDDVLHEENEEREEQSDPEGLQVSFDEFLRTDEHRPAFPGLDNDAPTQSAEDQPSGSPEASQETQSRAHTTLDRILDEVSIEENMESKREKLHEPGELREESGCPGGDSTWKAAWKGAEVNDEISGNVNEQGETLETASHIAWKQLHRVIVLEHTPVRTHSETAQALSTEAAYPH